MVTIEAADPETPQVKQGMIGDEAHERVNCN